MAKQVVDFRQGGPLTGDSGERGNNVPGIDSIKPIDDGERAVAANLDRPPENLRQRTEVLREETEDQKYLQDADMHWILTSGKADGLHDPGTLWPTIATWEEEVADPAHGWYFSLTPGVAVVVQPLNTPSVDLQESKTWEFPFGAATGYITIEMNRRAYSGANIREVVWQALPAADILGIHGTLGVCDLAVSGEDNHILTITLEDSGLVTQLLHLNAAFIGYVATLVASGFVCSTSGNPATLITLGDIPIGEEDYIFFGTFDRELHYIQAATFAAFFAASFDNLLSDGDTLAVVWECLTEPSPGVDGRRQAIPANANTEVLIGQLFKTSVHPEWIPLAVPLCKRIHNELVWLDGTVVTPSLAVPIRFGENGFTVNRIYSAPTTIPITMTSKWYGAIAAPLWVTVQQALDGIVADLAASTVGKGANWIGVPQTAAASTSLGYYNVPALGDSLYAVITQILALANAKASLGLGAGFGAEEVITGRWRFDNHVRIGVDKVVLRSSPSDAGWHLVYRNSGRTETNTDVDWDTLSIYEQRSSGVIVSRMEVYGGCLTALGSITSPVAGVGSISFVGISNGSAPVQVSGFRQTVTAPLTLNPLLDTDWDFYSTQDVAGGYVDKIISGTPIPPPPGRVVARQIWEIPQQLNAPVTLNSILYLTGSGYVQGDGEANPLNLNTLYLGAGAFEPSIFYNDQMLFMVTNAVYDNVGHNWSSISNSDCSSGWMILTESLLSGGVFQLYQRPTASSWLITMWDTATRLDGTGLTSATYSRASLTSGTTTNTNIPDTINGLLVVSMTHPVGGRRTAIFRVDGAGTELISGNIGPGPAPLIIWSDDLVLGELVGSCFVHLDGVLHVITIKNSFVADTLTAITVGTYLGD